MRHELITFGIASQRFGIDIMTVREIRAWSPVTRLPRVPDYVAGVVNLRGAVLPVVDLAARLGWQPTEATPRNPIIVIEHEGQLRGLIVHDVADIVSIDAGSLQNPDAMGHETITHFIQGIAPLGEEMVMVLDLARLMIDEPLDLAA
ncbi:MAG: chemotaxis protein CheW [Erythrobacter sp.]|jgi:purine-binding chemotaxis protein CheW|uniref:chemotaxis protein CheW n=1 Tax=Erythrobacter sp. TaxID=1042 RepID=UPI002B489567|nr:chemotaxis protein CheW [Erythrobacter sp.]WRH70566.1 MAG: chemotaxis protein CheW [Erythrobacter sp.]